MSTNAIFTPDVEHVAREAAKHARRKALEEAAARIEQMVVGGRAWTEAQAIAETALVAAARNVRELMENT